MARVIVDPELAVPETVDVEGAALAIVDRRVSDRPARNAFLNGLTKTATIISVAMSS